MAQWHNGTSVTPVSLQKFVFDLTSREVTLQKRNKKNLTSSLDYLASVLSVLF